MGTFFYLQHTHSSALSDALQSLENVFNFGILSRSDFIMKPAVKNMSSFEFPTSFINENPYFIILQPKTNAFKSSSKNFMRTVYIFKCTILSLNGLKKRTRIRLKFISQIDLTKDGSLCDYWYSRNFYLIAVWLRLCYISKHWQLASMQPGLSF